MTQKRSKQQAIKPVEEDGFALPLTITIAFTILLATTASLTRALTANLGTTRQSHAEDARELAEAGIAHTIENLNSEYPYLLINQYSEGNYANSGNWGNPTFPSSRCPGTASTGHPQLTKDIELPQGRYHIDEFRFEGTQFYGGTGHLKVTGERLDSSEDQLLASATIETSFDIKPKNCDSVFGQPAKSSGFPGLLGWSINLGGNDVLGRISGNVLCIDCKELSEFGDNRNSIIGGEKFMGPINVPPIPIFPKELTATEKTITRCQRIYAGSTNGGFCAVDNNGVTHCKIKDINLRKGFLRVDSEAGPIRLYISGDVSAGGKAGIIHSSGSNDNPDPARLSLFGNPRDNSIETHQTVMLSGASKPAKAANLFAFFPDGTVGINGGAQGTAICDEETGECGGGDVYGSVWAKEWNGSNSNNAQLVVPANMGDQLYTYLGKDFAIGIRDYVALGNNSWANSKHN